MGNYSWLVKHYSFLPRTVKRVVTSRSASKSISKLLKIQHRFPKVYVPRSKIADCLNRKGHRQAALRFWSLTIRDFRDIPNPHFQRGSWAINSGRFNEAAVQFRACIAKDSGYFRVTAHFYAAEALYRSGRYKEALQHISHVPEDYSEHWFLDYRSRSKGDLSSDILARIESDT